MAYVYLLSSLKEKWVYVGSTTDIEKRLSQHNSGQVFSTQHRRPYKLIYSEQYDTLQEARVREKQIKAVRKIKEELVRKHQALSSIG
ncbi:MAG: GIY-YIG nuclease family protein [Nanoarchaeota archaeon]